MHNYNTDYRELDSLREQVELLKNKLDAQQIISQRAMLATIHKGVKDLNKRYTLPLAITGLIGGIYCFWAFYYFFDFSLYFAIFTSLMMFVAATFFFTMHKRLADVDISQRNLLTVASEITRFRKIWSNWPMYSVPVLMVWLFWLVFEEATIIPEGAMRNGFFGGGSFGLIVGGIIGLRSHRKGIKNVDMILEQIRELQESEKLLADK